MTSVRFVSGASGAQDEVRQDVSEQHDDCDEAVRCRRLRCARDPLRRGRRGAEPAASGLLRVCADPDNMPFSNAEGQGFENKLAELIAEKLDARLEYSWFAEESG